MIQLPTLIAFAPAIFLASMQSEAEAPVTAPDAAAERQLPAMFLTAAPQEQFEPSEPGADGEPEIKEYELQWTSCETGETVLFQAETIFDESDYTVEVCFAAGEGVDDARISTVLTGGGGPYRVSCLASECAGIIDFKLYTRYRFTTLSLSWSGDTGTHRLEETFDAQDLSQNPVNTSRHTWATQWMVENGVEALPEPLKLNTEPLSLMRLQAHIPSCP
ncbi:MAG: hypothetical protein ABJP48_07940 [Erythrobacter sp.]